jgi:hypothetical protein
MKPTAAETENAGRRAPGPCAADQVNGTMDRISMACARAEGPEQQRKDHQRGDRHDHFQALHGALLVFELSAPVIW